MLPAPAVVAAIAGVGLPLIFFMLAGALDSAPACALASGWVFGIAAASLGIGALLRHTTRRSAAVVAIVLGMLALPWSCACGYATAMSGMRF